MGARERVHRAIESAVGDADKTLSEAPHAGDHERLTILLDGWFRGLADALEELAIEVDLLRASRIEDDELEPAGAAATSIREPSRSLEPQARTHENTPDDEAALAERARASREQTQAVRTETGARTANDTTEEG
jgi:hypothetical protein